EFEGADIDATSVSAFGRKFARTKVSARRAGDEWRIALSGGDVAGTAVWHPANADAPNGRVVARLSRLTLPAAAEERDPNQSARKARPAGGANAWPAIDLVSDAFYAKEQDLGKLEFAARPTGNDWQIQTLTLKN